MGTMTFERFGRHLAALSVLFALLGCVGEQSPLLSSRDGLVDRTLIGKYRVRHLGDVFRPTRKNEPPPVPDTFELFIKDSTYLIANDDDVMYLATLYPLRSETTLVQIRKSREPGYLYLIMKRDKSWFELRNIECGKTGDMFGHCSPKTKDELLTLANANAWDSNYDPKYSLVAERQE